MSRPADFLTNIRRMVKLHECMLKRVCQDYQLTLVDATVISFLFNNPGKDTAADIVELRMLSKGSVSQAVEGLIQKSLLRRRQDMEDRRKIHLSLTPDAAPVTKEVEAIRSQFNQEVFFGLSQEEKDLFDRVNQKMMENTKRALIRRGKV